MALINTAVLYEINAHVYLNKLSSKYNKQLELGDVPDEEIKKLANLGIAGIWLMGVWQRSPKSVYIGKQDVGLQGAFVKILPDMQDEDFIGSAYSVHEYRVDKKLGGENSLAILRRKLNKYNIDLILDFVPNHTAPDHPWVVKHPDFYIQGSKEELAKDPSSFIDCGGVILANGKDPQYAPWSDVVQVNAFSAGYRKEVVNTLNKMAKICDGVRCDMAMLMMNKIFVKTWGKKAGLAPKKDFWLDIISAVRKNRLDFIFLAEAYWDTEEELIDQGFDFCYDKTLYDLLLEGDNQKVEEHLDKTHKYQARLARFIENHDEERASLAYTKKHRAAAIIIATLPGLWLFHDGQAEGYRTKIPVHLARGPEEDIDQELYKYYEKILRTIAKWNISGCNWQLIKNDNKNLFSWEWVNKSVTHLVLVNYSDSNARIRIPLPNSFYDELSNKKIHPKGSELNIKLNPWQILLLSSD
jgi:glycosidase